MNPASSTHRPRTPGAPRRVLRAGLRGLEWVLGVGGLVCTALYVAACAQAQHTQTATREAFDSALARQQALHREAPDFRDWSPGRIERYEASREAAVEALGRLEIPAADVSVMVLDGTDETTLDRAVGRIEGTARLGEDGNLGIAGHRDGYFRGLRHLEAGDALSLTTLGGVTHYEVAQIDIVTPDRVDVLAPTDEPTLTLVTCYPFYFVGDAPQRYIVTARQTRFDPWQQPAPVQAGPRKVARR
ncbi:MAG: class D sortase [Myxococcota bacterium]